MRKETDLSGKFYGTIWQSEHAFIICIVFLISILPFMGNRNAFSQQPWEWQLDKQKQEQENYNKKVNEDFLNKMEQTSKVLQDLQDERDRLLHGERTTYAPIDDPLHRLAAFQAIGCWEKYCTDETRMNGYFGVGLAYETGEGIEKDLASAYAWYKQAADKGHVQANVNIGKLIESGKISGDKSDLLKYYEFAANARSLEANYLLGRLYYDGSFNGIEMDREKAIKYFHSATGFISDEATRAIDKAANRALDIAYGERYLEESFTSYQKGADRDDSWSQVKLAEAYEKGNGISKDLLKAAYWYRRADIKGRDKREALQRIYSENPGIKQHGEDLYASGVTYEEGRGVAKDLTKAYALYRNAGEYGSAIAMFKLGKAYQDGSGVDKDIKQAYLWYGQAAVEGYAEASYKLATDNDFVVGGPGLDDIARKRWYKKAGEQGHIESLRWLLNSGDSTKKESINWANKLAEKGDPEGQYKLGKFYQTGDGVDMDLIKARELFAKAAAQGNQDAITVLKDRSEFEKDLSYYSGDGAIKDPSQAVSWYRKYAEMDYAECQYLLAESYATGTGVKKDKQLALHWYKLAADLNHGQAQYALAMEYEKAGEKDLALKWYIRAGVNKIPVNDKIKYYSDDFKLMSQIADKGDLDAIYTLGLIFESGYTQTKNEKNAVIWYERAAKEGHAGSQRQLAEIYSNDRSAYFDLNKAQIYLTKLIEKKDANAELKMFKMYAKNGQNYMYDSLLKRAAEHGNDEAQYLYGLEIENNPLSKMDYFAKQTYAKQAKKWYEKSAVQGNKNAIEKLKTLGN
jgi:TPR repeat protein